MSGVANVLDLPEPTTETSVSLSRCEVWSCFSVWALVCLEKVLAKVCQEEGKGGNKKRKCIFTEARKEEKEEVRCVFPAWSSPPEVCARELFGARQQGKGEEGEEQLVKVAPPLKTVNWPTSVSIISLPVGRRVWCRHSALSFKKWLKPNGKMNAICRTFLFS